MYPVVGQRRQEVADVLPVLVERQVRGRTHAEPVAGVLATQPRIVGAAKFVRRGQQALRLRRGALSSEHSAMRSVRSSVVGHTSLVSATGGRSVSLPGGFVNDVIRIGDTVRRPARAGAGAVWCLLDHFEQRGWTGAPRLLGVDEQGREILSFIDGHVAWQRVQPPAVYGQASLVRVAQLVREFHDLTAGTTLAGDHEVVCHNDLSPKNTVYRPTGAGLRPVAFLDWDLAAPGPRVHDVAQMCSTFLALGPSCDLDEAARMVRVLTDAYGLADRDRLIDTIIAVQDRCWRGIETAAACGDRRAIAMREGGIVGEIRDCHQWTVEHAVTLQAALR
jgi:hypothetical protein